MPAAILGGTGIYNLPGVEVNEDGTIEVEGKEVTKITVEGKDFFDYQTRQGPFNAAPQNKLSR